MRHRAVADLAAHAVEADVGDVMLAAGVEAARDLDLEILDRLVELEVAGLDAAPQLGGEAARRRDAELAGVGARAGGDVDQRRGAGKRQADGGEIAVERREDRAPRSSAGRSSAPPWCADRPPLYRRAIAGQRAELARGDVAERQAHGGHRSSRLALRQHVGRAPALERARRRDRLRMATMDARSAPSSRGRLRQGASVRRR